MKHINDILNESILDDNFGDNLDEKIILDWFSRHSSSKIKVDKDLKVSAGYLSMYLDDNEPEIPDWIQFNDVKIFRLDLSFDHKVKEYKLSNIPTNCEKFKLECYNVDRLIIDVPSLRVNQEINISSPGNSGCTELVFPNNVDCDFINLDRCNLLESFKCKKLNTKSLNLPRQLTGNVVRSALGLDKKTSVSMCGNTMF